MHCISGASNLTLESKDISTDQCFGWNDCVKPS